MLAASAGTTIAYILIIKEHLRFSLKWNRLFLFGLFKRSLPLFGALALTTAYANADTLIIGQMLGAEAVGFYQGAYKFLFVFQSFNLFNTAFFPRLSIYIKIRDYHVFNRLNVVVMFFCLFTPSHLWLYFSLNPCFFSFTVKRCYPSLIP